MLRAYKETYVYSTEDAVRILYLYIAYSSTNKGNVQSGDFSITCIGPNLPKGRRVKEQLNKNHCNNTSKLKYSYWKMTLQRLAL
jgi:hypothetical protein